METRTLDIEARRQEEAKEPPPRAADVQPTVLLIDDDPDVLKALADWLDRVGYAAVTATDGVEGLAQLRAGLHPSAIVLDLLMPRMDGWTFLSRLRADPERADTRVIVASATTRDFPPGADAWLSKPFDPAELSRTIARLCGS